MLISGSGLGVNGSQQFLNFSSGRTCCSSAVRSVLSGASFRGQVLISNSVLSRAGTQSQDSVLPGKGVTGELSVEHIYMFK